MDPISPQDAARILSAQRKPRVLHCPICGTAFKATGGRAQYCSPRCKYTARQARQKEVLPCRP